MYACEMVGLLHGVRQCLEAQCSVCAWCMQSLTPYFNDNKEVSRKHEHGGYSVMQSKHNTANDDEHPIFKRLK